MWFAQCKQQTSSRGLKAIEQKIDTPMPNAMGDTALMLLVAQHSASPAALAPCVTLHAQLAPASLLARHPTRQFNAFGKLLEASDVGTVNAVLTASVRQARAAAPAPAPGCSGDVVQVLLQACADAGIEAACRLLVTECQADADTVRPTRRAALKCWQRQATQS